MKIAWNMNATLGFFLLGFVNTVIVGLYFIPSSLHSFLFPFLGLFLMIGITLFIQAYHQLNAKLQWQTLMRDILRDELSDAINDVRILREALVEARSLAVDGGGKQDELRSSGPDLSGAAGEVEGNSATG